MRNMISGMIYICIEEIYVIIAFDRITWVPIDPVDPTIEIGFGPPQDLRPGSATARPGQAGGGACCIEQLVLPLDGTVPFSFLLKGNPTEKGNVPKLQEPTHSTTQQKNQKVEPESFELL